MVQLVGHRLMAMDVADGSKSANSTEPGTKSSPRSRIVASSEAYKVSLEVIAQGRDALDLLADHPESRPSRRHP